MAKNPDPSDDAQGKPSDAAEDKTADADRGGARDQTAEYFESMTVRLDSAIAAKIAGLRPPADQTPGPATPPALSNAEGPALSSVERPAPITVEAEDAALDVPTLDRVLGRESTPPTPAPSSTAVADAFAALLALEEGEPGAKPVRLVSGDGGGEPRITDALLEELTRRIIERLAPNTAREVVVEVVSEVAERLVSAEIDRIRNKHA